MPVCLHRITAYIQYAFEQETELRVFKDLSDDGFGYLFSEIKHIPMYLGLNFRVNDLDSKLDVLNQYLELNTGGTIHSDEEIEKVKLLIEEERKNITKD